MAVCKHFFIFKLFQRVIRKQGENPHYSLTADRYQQGAFLTELFYTKHMKGYFIYLIVPFLFLVSCQSGKYVTEFNSIKKTIDTLVILPMNVKVYVKGDSDKKLDTEVAKEIGQHLSEQTLKLLKNKYKIVYDSTFYEYNSVSDNEIVELIQLLDVKENPINDIYIPKSLEELSNQYDNQYFLLMFFRGFYTAGISPYEKASRDVVYLSSPNFGNMKLNLILFDNSNKKVLFFEESLVRDDPRLANLIEQMTMQDLKTIYYK